MVPPALIKIPLVLTSLLMMLKEPPGEQLLAQVSDAGGAALSTERNFKITETLATASGPELPVAVPGAQAALTAVQPVEVTRIASASFGPVGLLGSKGTAEKATVKLGSVEVPSTAVAVAVDAGAAGQLHVKAVPLILHPG